MNCAFNFCSPNEFLAESRKIAKQPCEVKGGTKCRERSDEPLTHGGFVICSQGRETSWGAKIALQIDFELTVFHKKEKLQNQRRRKNE
jgi:hypothetical protein